jgi:fructokinase
MGPVNEVTAPEIVATGPEIVAIGEALVDFIPDEAAGEWRYTARPGGAPANVAVGLARLGRRVAFVGRVGADPLGSLVVDALEAAGVDVRWVQRDRRRATTVAVVMPATESHTRFLIYRTGAADAALRRSEVPLGAVRGARLVHAGTLSLAAPASRRATLAAVDAARAAGVAVSVDVNLRPVAWRDPGRMSEAARELLARADIAKLTHEELGALGLTPADVLERGPVVVLVTDGEYGAAAHTREGSVSRPALRVPVVDPTGAGDAFMGTFLHVVLESAEGLEKAGEPRRRTAGSGGPAMSRVRGIPMAVVEEALDAAIWAGAFAVQRVGAMQSLPTAEDIARRRGTVS